jgi:O-methyltransferase involved in polyketide biosynthesis
VPVEDGDSGLALGLGFDPTVPSPARMWNYWVGGKDHFAADRDAADLATEVMPDLPDVAKSVRVFLREIVHSLAAEHGIRQFIDIGTGLPTADNTHEVAQRAAPDARVLYVDRDPSVLAHARALLVGTSEGETRYLQADLRDTDMILKAAAAMLDLGQPVAVLLFAVLHFVSDDEEPYRVTATLMEAMPPGSFLVIVHAPSDLFPQDATEEHFRRYNDSGAGRVRPRSHAEVSRFFDGLELLPPGVATLNNWLTPRGIAAGSGLAWAGVARKA